MISNELFGSLETRDGILRRIIRLLTMIHYSQTMDHQVSETLNTINL